MTNDVLVDENVKNHLLTRIPLKRVAQASEVASLVYFLATDESSYITGTYIPIDGGYLSSNSVSLITGAASGIGRHLAIHASNLGHDVVLIDLDANGLDETKKLCSKAETFCIDVGNYVQMLEVKEALDKKNIKVNYLFNNAGIFIEGRSWKTSPEMWNKIISTNLVGITNVLNVFLDQMLKTDTKGHIVNTASMAGVIVGGFLAPYTATKHAVVGLSRSLYEELKETNANIGVSVLCPGLSKVK